MEVKKRKQLDLHPTYWHKLEGKAKRANMLLKPYAEEILINHALSEQVITKELGK